MRTVVECLIIVALVELLYFNLTSIPKRQCTPPEIATMIKKHFGVEE